MSGENDKIDEVLDRIVLDMKALALLYGSEDALREAIAPKVMDSTDDEVRTFVGAVRSGRSAGVLRLVAMAIGEVVLASLLVLAGTVTLIPTIVGLSTPSEYVKYFSEAVFGAIGSTALGQYVSVIEFAIGTFLMLAAFYTLRQAADLLQEAGLTTKKVD